MTTVIKTRLPNNRRPSISLKKTLRAVAKGCSSIFNAIIEARRLQSAYYTAYHLKMHNPDFKQMSHADLVQQVLTSYKK